MNLAPLLEQLSIIDTNGKLIPFRLNWAQQEYLQSVHSQHSKGKPVRVIVLKARQLGISTLTEGIMFLKCFMKDHTKALVMADDVGNGQGLLGITENYWETYPYRFMFTPKYQSKNELAWVETKSSMKVMTAANKKAGRSKTIQCLHASEVAFWPAPKEVMTGLMQSIHDLHDTFICLESTANGIGGYFCEQWDAAVAGDTEYLPLFFPWYKHPAYTMSYITGATPPSLTNLSDEEQVLARMGIDTDHLAWRRWAIRNKTQNSVQQFHQEYPSTPEEAFIATGTNVFPLEYLRKCYQPLEPIRGRLHRNGSQVEFQVETTGPLNIYAWPSQDTDYGVYFVGGDPTHVTQGDYACAQVINRRTYEQVAVWRGKIDPASFAEELAKLGMYYNTAMLTTEIEGPGYMTIGALLQLDYPRLWKNQWADKDPGIVGVTYGWSTSHKRKEWAVGFLLKLVVDADVTIHDSKTFAEMKNFVKLPNGEYGNASKNDDDGEKHDDTVMALAITCVCNSTEILSPYMGPVANLELVRDTFEEWDAGNLTR